MSAVWGGLVGSGGWLALVIYLSAIGMLGLLATSDQEIPFPQFISE